MENPKRGRGRPKGSKSKRTLGKELVKANMERNRERAEAGEPHVVKRVFAFSEDLTPLIVLRQSMEHFYLSAPVELQQLYESLKAAHEVAKAENDPAEIKRTASEMLQAYRELKALRLDAVNVAVQAAAYVHPRLSATPPLPNETETQDRPDPHYERMAEAGKMFEVTK